MVGEELIVRVGRMAHGGEALGRAGGRVVFVKGAVPGEVVRARVVGEKKRWARARLLEVIEPSPQRIDPLCPYFGTCGGCHWQHIRYAAQLDYKRQVVVDQLRRLGHVADPPVLPTLGMSRPWAYRNHVQFAVNKAGQIGLRMAHSHQVVPVAKCLLLHPLLAGLYRAFRIIYVETLSRAPVARSSPPMFATEAQKKPGNPEIPLRPRRLGSNIGTLKSPMLHDGPDVTWPHLQRLTLRAGVRTGERMVILETGSGTLSGELLERLTRVAGELASSVAYDDSGESGFVSCILRTGDGDEFVLRGRGAYYEVLNGRRFRVSASSFFQVNTEQAGRLVSLVSEYLEPCKEDTLLDVYCGVGTFGLSVRRSVGRVIGIEGHPAAAADARANAGGDVGYTLLQGRAEELVSGLPTVTKVVLDPPRRGCERRVLDALLRLSPRRIVYVSCDPATLARDAAVLIGGGYELVKVQPLDMFPQTFHVETVSLWRHRQ